ncbi:MAG TPA: hypothetical protein VE869_06020 [Gemmatimonas sp.]|nr:hypothetical protein [Gemmatimonas sp.]
MFDQLRDSLRSLSGRLPPEERRRVTSAMRDAMIHAKVSLQDLRDGIATTESRLAKERAELDTVRRRQGLAAGIGDQETVAVAERFATQHAERVTMLETKLMSQQQELTVAERELDDMSTQLRMAISGLDSTMGGHDATARREVDALLDDSMDSNDDARSPEHTTVRRSRAEREADAEDRLAELKRRMGK